MSKIIHKDSKTREWNGKNYESTGCMSLDMVVNCVNFYRERQRPLKSITLSNAHYDRIDDFCRKNFITDEELKDETNETRRFMLDGVNIERAGMLYVDELKVEFFPIVRPEEALFENRAKVDFSGLEQKMKDLTDPTAPKVKVTITKE